MKLENKVKVFMSATGTSLFNFIKETASNEPKKVWKYTSKKNYKHIASLHFYKNNDAIENFIQHRFRGDEKVIWFCKSAEKAAKLHAKYPDSHFLCSSSNKNKKYLKLIEDDTFISTGDKITFNRKYLFTTKVLDNGFDLKDEQIKLIICDEFDINTMIQCLGRKRILSDADKVHVVLFNHSSPSIHGFRNVLNDKLGEVNAFLEGGVTGRNNYVGRFAHRSNYIIYDQPSKEQKYSSDKKISRVKYLKTENDLSIIEEMISRNKEVNKLRMDSGEKKRSDTYMMYILELMDKDRCGDLDRMYEQQELVDYLDSILGKQLFKKEQKKLIDKVNIRSNGKQLKSYEALNIALTELGLDYRIVTDKDWTRIVDGNINSNRGKVYWRVMKLTS
ncbi:DNA/RNA helicase [Paenibacillus sp. FSL R10-2788]|uniref:DNA/RNA helicase n=1 Tax=Paenibacillus sp. FSL R10-2788 TaxID=2954694 RepID=UPI0030F7EEA5